MRTTATMARARVSGSLRAAAVFGVVGLTVARAHAEAPDLEWTAPDSCPTFAEASARLRELLPASERARSSVVVRAQIAQQASDRFRLELAVTTLDRTARRTLTAASCPDIAEAALVLAALAIKGDFERPAELSVKPLPAKVPSQAPTVGAALLASSLVYGMPDPTFGFAVRASLGRGSWELDLAFAQHFSPALVVPGAGQGSLSLSTQRLELRVCQRFGQRVLVGPCLGVEGTRSAATTQSITQEGSSAHFWAGAGVWLAALVPVSGHVSAVADVGASLPVSARPVFAVEGVGVVARTSSWSLGAHLGVAARFW